MPRLRLSVTFRVALAAAMLLAPWQARASTAALESCAAIGDDRARLGCYDRLSGRARSVAAPSPTAAPDRPRELSARAAPAASVPGAVGAAPPPASLLDRAWGFEPDSERYAIGLYRANYLQVARYGSRPNDQPFTPLFNAFDGEDQDLDSIEAAFQLSFKARLWTSDDRRLGLWAAYTQQSRWQVYNEALSSPFRDTNYMPELLVSFRPDLTFGGFHWRLFNFGYAHQSNGRADPISRSWDRLIAEFGIERGDFALLIRPWVRIDDENSDDDNPDIVDYLGHGDISAIYKWRGHSFNLMARGNPDTGKGAARLTWTTRPLLGPLRGYVDLFSGYGDTLLDYNWKQNIVGVGIALNDTLDRR